MILWDTAKLYSTVADDNSNKKPIVNFAQLQCWQMQPQTWKIILSTGEQYKEVLDHIDVQAESDE